MSHPLVDKILRDGVQSVNVAMLSPELRKKLLTDAGMTLMHQGKHREAAHAFALGANSDALREHGQWFQKQGRVGLAAHFLLHVEERPVLEKLAQLCITANDIDAALAIYESLNDETMVRFIRENFLQTQM